MESQIEIFNKYKRLAYKIANQFSYIWPHYKDEIESAAMFGLWEAAKKTECDNPISLYSAIIKNHILYVSTKFDPISKWYKRKIADGEMDEISFVSTDSHSQSDDSSGFESKLFTEIDSAIGHSETIEDQLIQKEIELERSKIVRSAIKQLPQKQRFIVRSIFFKGKSGNELAKEWNCSGENVLRQKRNALKTMSQSNSLKKLNTKLN